MMTSICNKKVHPFLCLPNYKDNGTHLDFPLLPLRNVSAAASIGGDPPKATTMPPPAKKDPGGIGFLDEVGGSVDGLMSCTESLGFESSDERAVDDQIEDLGINHDHRRDGLGSFSRRSNCGNNNTNNNDMDKKEKKKFPPPLSSLSQDGKPNFFLHAVRKDGRLELKEVKIDRPETLRASRQDGRLRLHLIRDLEQEEEEDDDDFSVEDDENEVIETDEEIIEEEGEEEKIEEWKFPVRGSGRAEGHRRCYGGGHGHNNNHHPYDFQVWRQRCVTTR